MTFKYLRELASKVATMICAILIQLLHLIILFIIIIHMNKRNYDDEILNANHI